MASSPRAPDRILGAGNWKLLTPPPIAIEKDDIIEVGVVEVHPSLNRVAYTTRGRNDQSQDLGRARIVIHDFEETPNNGNGEVVAYFTLRELNKRINEFRTKSHTAMLAASAHSTHSHLHSLSAATVPSVMPYTVQMLGAVQNISFLSRDAIRCHLPPGYVKDEPSRMERLMIGFRRCIVVVSVFHLKDQNKDSCARGVQLVAYIGPDDLDEYEHNEKARKRQPSSFPISITENIVAYGCYDGGIRFYDIVRRKQVKSALGPNGRGNPIVRLINANRNPCNDSSHLEVKGKRTSGCQTILPRIVSVCATGIAFLWELDLSIELGTQEILFFDIPPPLVSVDGLVAAVSGKGIPVKYPPTLSPASIATLSPCSSWEQTDEVNSQFEVSFDPHENRMYWVFSPDCIGSSVTPHANREERLNLNGVLVCWQLSNLPRPEWPPPILPPSFVTQLPRTDSGRVSAEMVLPSIYGNGILPGSYLATIYITSSSKLMASVADLEKHMDAVQIESSVFDLADLKSLDYGQSGYNSYAIAASWNQPSLIAIGTQFGILFAKVVCSTLPSSGFNNVRKQLFPGEPVDQHARTSMVRSSSDCTSDKDRIHYQQHQQVLHDEELQLLRSRVTHLLEEHAKYRDMSETEISEAVSKVEALENNLRLKDKAYKSLQAETAVLKADLEREKQINQDTKLNLRTLEGETETLEKEATVRESLMNEVQEECDRLRQQLDAYQKDLEEIERRESDSRLTTRDYILETKLSSDSLQKDLSVAKETEESLRNYIALLEEDKAAQDKELEEARQQAEKFAAKYERLAANLRADVKEQKAAIDSLVDLLERQRIDHEKETADQNDEISSLKRQLSDLKKNNQSESNEEKIDNEIFLAMKVELQNALNELAIYQHQHKGKG